MERIAEFEFVSEKQFAENGGKPDKYNSLSLPVRATFGSAGYDIKTPEDIKLNPGETVRIATGLRCRINNGWVLMIFPKSGLGLKFRVQLDNTVGIIDSDYYNAENEGHILVQITNDSKSSKVLEIPEGKAFCQGVFLPFGITFSDEAEGERKGGFGSTNA